jgi:hypothetical protein
VEAVVAVDQVALTTLEVVEVELVDSEQELAIK